MSVEGRRIAIVGAGVFGCTVALDLAAAGARVALFERLPEILAGATKNNLNRLHLGFHYPRHFETASQSEVGFEPFKRAFPHCVAPTFPNAYFIAAEDSVTAPEDYLGFCQRLGHPFERIDPATFPTEVRACELAIRCEESVYDRDVLARMLRKRLDTNALVELHCSAEVARLSARANGYALKLGDGSDAGRFEAVINCSYAEINRLTKQLGLPLPTYQFEYTMVPIVELDLPRIGFAVMDGPFPSLLPFGLGGQFLFYHVIHSVVATEIQTTMDPAWSEPDTAPFARIDKEARFRDMCRDAAQFVPALARAHLAGFLEGPRMVLANHDGDDARPSLVSDYDNGYLTVFSGKIVQALGVAGDVRARLSRFFHRESVGSGRAASASSSAAG